MSVETHAPPLRVISLHDLGYCHRLFYLTEVEGLQAPNAAIYAGRELHASLAVDEDGERTQLELADPGLGLVGKVDAIRRRDGSLIPYEHKRGRARKDGKVTAAWPSDRLQVVAYAALIESATGEAIPEGRVRYHADNVTVRVPIDEAARADLAAAVAEARRLRDRPSGRRSPRTNGSAPAARWRRSACPRRSRQAEHPEPRAGPALPARSRRGQPARRHRRRPRRSLGRDAGRHPARRRAAEPARDPGDRCPDPPRSCPGDHPGPGPLC